MFLFGHHIADDNWSALLQNSELLAVSVLVFAPLTMLVAPLLFGYDL
ncbi:MAG: hypothetical protein ACI9PP_000009 [Halobacteriales archaeon]